MKYVVWLWTNSRGIRWNSAVRIVIGIVQVALGLLMILLSKRFIDETIRTGSFDDVLRMVLWLVLTVVGGVVLRQVGFWLTTTAGVRQTNALRVSSVACSVASSSTVTSCTQAISPHDWRKTSIR